MTNNKILHGFIFCAGGLIATIVIGAAFALSSHRSSPYVDLPEEISQAAAGDTLYILKNTKDTLSLGFH